MNTLRYHLNSFYFQKMLFEQHLKSYFDFSFSPSYFESRLPAWKYVPLNILRLTKLFATDEHKKYDVLQLNRPEAFWMFKPAKKQISVFEAHGYDVGIWAERYLVDIKSVWKKKVGAVLDAAISPRIKKNINVADIWYCSTPDLVDPLEEWAGRRPEWLPNPIDVDFFTPEGPVAKLQGSPACFLAARLHGDKKPEVAIKIFQEVIKPRYKDAALHFISSGELVERYKRELSDSKTYIWHPYMTKDELAAKLRGADLTFGDFSIGALSMLPLQVMALKKPIVTLDAYEIIKKPLESLAEFSLDLLEKPEIKQQWIERNFNHVHEKHAPRSIALHHLANLRRVGYAKGIIIPDTL